MNEIYLIQKLWSNEFENNIWAALGYETVGFVTTIKEAEKIVKDGGNIPKSMCWAMKKDMPKYQYFEIKQFKEE